MNGMRAGGAAGACARSRVGRVGAMARRAGLALALLMGGATAAAAGTNYFLHVEVEGPGRVDGMRDGWYPAGTPVRLIALPGEAGAFIEWTGDVPPGAALQNPLETVLDHSRAFVAHFRTQAPPRIVVTPPALTNLSVLAGGITQAVLGVRNEGSEGLVFSIAEEVRPRQPPVFAARHVLLSNGAVGVAAALAAPLAMLAPPEPRGIDVEGSMYPTQDAVADDLDHDGDMDVVAIWSPQIIWFENDGAQHYTQRMVITPAIGTVHELAVHDMDRDGDRDVVYAAESQGADVGWCVNDGSQGFTDRAIDRDLRGCNAIDVLDAGGDTWPSILAASYMSNSIMRYAQSAGQFIPVPVGPANAASRDVIARDLDRDGDLDVIGALSGSDQDGFAWWECLGDRSLVQHPIATPTRYTESVEAADVDGDGDVDLLAAVSYPDNKLLWYENNGAQVFTPRIVDSSLLNPQELTAGDLDGDGDQDLVGISMSAGTTYVLWYENDGRQAFGRHVIAADRAGPISVQIADMDRDGDGDILCANFYGGSVEWWENDSQPGHSDWLRVEPDHGEVAPGLECRVRVGIDASRATPGTCLQSALRVQSNDPRMPVVIVPVAACVLPETPTTTLPPSTTTSTSSSTTTTQTQTTTSSTTVAVTSTSTTTAPRPVVAWQQVNAAAPWVPRTEAGAVAFRERLWLMGGQNFASVRYNDVWNSADGRAWALVTNEAPWCTRQTPMSAVFRERMWIFGGAHQGTPLNDVWSSFDGAQWTAVTTNAPWGARRGAATAVLAGKLWLMGGEGYTPGSGYLEFGDIWCTSNGTDWIQPNLPAPWGTRSFASAVVLNGRIWLMGGYRGGVGLNDVWSSGDGMNWVRETAAAPWLARWGFGAVAFDGRLWVMGGLNARAQRMQDVWSSPDGKAWQLSASPVIWSARCSPAAAVHAGAMWVFAGESGYGQGLNDVWRSPPAPVETTTSSTSTSTTTLPVLETTTTSTTSSSTTSAPPNPEAGLILHYTFDRVESARVADSSGYGHTGTVYGAVWISEGRRGGALAFDGDGDFVLARDSERLDLAGGSFTLAAWVRSSAVTRQMVFYKGDPRTSVGSTSYSLNLEGAPNTYPVGVAGFQIDDNVHDPFLKSPRSYHDGQWHLLVGVRDQASRQLKLFVDGVLATSTVDTATGSLANSYDLQIGRFNAGSWSGFNGALDDLRIYGRALSALEIVRLFQAAGPQDSTTTSTSSSTTSSTSTLPTLETTTSTTTSSSTTTLVHATTTTLAVTSSSTTTVATTSTTTTTAPVVTVHYVAMNGRHVAPFGTWATAATNIQAAVNVSAPGHVVIVGAGRYAGSPSPAGVSNRYGRARVSIEKAVRVTAADGPALTTIVGSGDGADPVRGAYLAGGAMLDGFTLIAGRTPVDETGGADATAYRRASGGGALGIGEAIVSNCVLVGNTADYGGGIACLDGARAVACTLRENSASVYAGGATAWFGGRLENCEIVANTSTKAGGVSLFDGGMLLRSRVLGNRATFAGGGVVGEVGCVLDACRIADNVADMAGGGLYLDGDACLVRNSLFTGNIANGNAPPLPAAQTGPMPKMAFEFGSGGGLFLERGRVENCSVSGNWATNNGGGLTCMAAGSVVNTIVHGNTSAGGTANFATIGTGWSAAFVCATPAPAGDHNLAADPLFVNALGGDFRLQSTSPCRDAGRNADWMVASRDLAGLPRLTGATVDIGAYEYNAALQDSDADGMSDAQEWLAGTDPLNRANVLSIQTISSLAPPEPTADGRAVAVLPSVGMEVRWQAAVGASYAIESADSLAAEFVTLASNVVADSTQELFVDTNRLDGTRFYRVRLE